MARKTEGECPIATNVYIRKQAKKEKISLREMMRRYSKDSDTPYSTLDRWVHPRKKGDVKSDVKSDLNSDKSEETQTKLEKEKEFTTLRDEILSGEVSIDHVKEMGDAIAEGIEKGIYPITVGTKVQPAIKNVTKKEKKDSGAKPIGNFERLQKHILKVIVGLQAWVDGEMKPETDEAVRAEGILAGAGRHIVLYGRLGVDVVGIY
jgi:hypothetical protein